jgi:hypothetical protein
MSGARPFLDADFPGYAEAVAREHVVRGAACMGLSEKICGFEVKPLTAAHVRWLTLTRSPFLLGGLKPADFDSRPFLMDDIMRFLWIVSPMFDLRRSQPKRHWWQRQTARDRFNTAFAAIMDQEVGTVCREILEYMEEAYLDMEESQVTNDKSYFAFEVMIAEELHRNYGYRVDFWNAMPPDKNPIHVPLKLIFQFRKLRKHQSGEKTLVSNRSEKFISDGLARMSQTEKN